jgi:hypothetical protein
VALSDLSGDHLLPKINGTSEYFHETKAARIVNDHSHKSSTKVKKGALITRSV